jgi:CHAT domain
MDFSTQNLLAFQNLWNNQPDLFSEEARLSLSQIISELEENLEKIARTIVTWCESYPEIDDALSDERNKLGADIPERNTRGTPEVTNSTEQINPQEYIKWMRDNFTPQSTTPPNNLTPPDPTISEQPIQNTSKTVKAEALNLPRYTDISCPRRVWKKTNRFSVVVRLTLQPSPYSDAPVEQLNITRENLPVIVHLDAPAFEHLNKPQQEITLEPNRDSIPIVFDLKPKDITGYYPLNFEFFQGGHLIGATSTKIEITAYEVSSESIFLPQTQLAALIESKPSDLILYVKYDPLGNERSLRYTLFRKGLQEPENYPPVNLQGNLETYADTLYSKITNLFNRTSLRLEPRENPTKTNGNNAEMDRRIKQIGHNLWKSLLPDELKKDYLEHPEKWQGKTLLIVSDEPYIPWELVWPYGNNPEWEDEVPWCISMQLTRWLRHDLQENTHQLPPSQLHFNKLACLAPAAAKLIEAQKEKQFLEQLIAANLLDDVSPKDCYLSDIWKLLETSRYNWFHIASHGNFKTDTPDDPSAILLENADNLTLDDFLDPKIESHIKKTRPAFVFNSCHSGRQSWALRGLGGWPNHLIGMGAGLFLAPLWPVSDGCALQFAQQFYQELLSGKTVAEAMLSSRLAIKDVSQGDSSWLAYSVYAHPNATVKTIKTFEEVIN